MLTWKAYTRTIDALAFSPCGRTLALGGRYLACRLIDAITGQRLWTTPSNSALGSSVAFTPGGSVLCQHGGVSVRSVVDGTEVWNSGNWCQSFGLAHDGRTAFVADGGFQDLVRCYDLQNGNRRGEAELASGAIKRIAVSPDGKLVAVVGCKRFLLLSAERLEVLVSEAQRALSNGALALAFSPCGRTLIYTASGTLFVWDVASAQEVNRVHLKAKHFMDAAFTPDGRRLITVSKQGTARVWDSATWECERCFTWNVGSLRAVAVAPDGTRAAAAGSTGRVVVWDLED